MALFINLLLSYPLELTSTTMAARYNQLIILSLLISDNNHYQRVLYFYIFYFIFVENNYIYNLVL